MIHSDQRGDRFVKQRVWKWFEDAVKKPDPRGGILVCSHAAILDLGPPPINATNYSLYFDEVPDAYSFAARRLDDGIRWIQHLISATPYKPGVLRLQPETGAEARLDWIARTLMATNSTRWSGTSPPICSIRNAMFSCWRIAGRTSPSSTAPHEFAGEIDILSILHPDRFKDWSRVSLMGARAPTP